ncbi:MAG: ATP-binding protein [Candidatus Omnitrophota bacterium]
MDQHLLNFTIGREEELKKLIKNLDEGIPTLLLGKPGTGKTHILKLLCQHLKEKRRPYLYIEKFKPVKETLINLYITLKKKVSQKQQKQIKRLTVTELTEEVILLLEEKSKTRPFILIFDHLEEITSSTADILQELSSLCIIFGACQFIRRIRTLRRFFWQFDIIEIEPLTKDESKLLVDRLIRLKRLKVKCRDFFINQVIANTSGIPLSIVETLNRAKTQKVITKSYVREMFIHGSGIKEIDASPFVILIFAFFIVMRFVYRGFGEYQGYALFGALTGIGIFIRYLLYRQARRGAQQ